MNTPHQRIIQGLEELEDGTAILMSLDASHFHQEVLYIFENIYPKIKKSALIISYGKPYRDYQKHLEELNISLNKFFIIDAHCDTTSKKVKNENVYCLSDPQALTELSIVLNEVMKEKKCEYLIFNNISLFLVHFGIQTTQRFMEYLLGRIISYSIKGVFLASSDKKSKEIMKGIAPLFREYIET